MVRRVSTRASATRIALALALVALPAGCGSGARDSTTTIDIDPPSTVHDMAARETTSPTGITEATPAQGDCAGKVLQVLRDVVTRVYHEGVTSERTGTAEHFITTSVPLREAIENGDAARARSTARALIAAGRMTSLRISRGGPGESSPGAPPAGGQVLAEVGSPSLAPIAGRLTDPAGTAIGSFLTSVWSDSGFVAEVDGVTEGLTSIRSHGASIGGSFPLPRGELPQAGTAKIHGVAYRYTSFPVTAYPSSAASVYLLRRASSFAALCGRDDQATLVNTLTRVATLIYRSERGAHASEQVQRVQHDQALLSAVARRDPTATRSAVEALLHEHVVRLRVSATGGQLLADVGGPYVLAPVTAPLRLRGRTIGSIVLSIQDDEGYKRLTGRLAGLRVLMYMGPTLVKNSLGPSPGSPPASGPYRYRGHSYRVFTLHAQAFPSGPLRIVVLIPIPYS